MFAVVVDRSFVAVLCFIGLGMLFTVFVLFNAVVLLGCLCLYAFVIVCWLY